MLYVIKIKLQAINGKTSLQKITTVGNINYFVSYKLSDGTLVNVYIFDTAGQEKYRSLSEKYYKNADCCLLVYDITDRKSFIEAKNIIILIS